MTFNLDEILASKRALRRELDARPVAEKLRMLDALRERALAIRSVKPAPSTGVLREELPPYGKSDDASPVRPQARSLPKPRQKTDVPTLGSPECGVQGSRSRARGSRSVAPPPHFSFVLSQFLLFGTLVRRWKRMRICLQAMQHTLMLRGNPRCLLTMRTDGDIQLTLADVLEVPPISQHGNGAEIIGKLAGAGQLHNAVNQLQTLLYAT